MAGIALGNLLYLAGEPGEPPLQPPGEIAYGMASTYGAFGIAVALYHRLESGRGQHIDVSMHECAGHIAGYFIPNYGYTGDKPARASRKGEETDLYDPYTTKNGYARIFIIPVEQWRRLVDWMGQSAVDLRARVRENGLPAQTSGDRRRRDRGVLQPAHKEELYEEGQKRRIAVTPDQYRRRVHRQRANQSARDFRRHGTSGDRQVRAIRSGAPIQRVAGRNHPHRAAARRAQPRRFTAAISA